MGATIVQLSRVSSAKQKMVARVHNCRMVRERSVNFPRSPDSTKNMAGSIVNQLSCVYYDYVPFVYYSSLWTLGPGWVQINIYFSSLWLFHKVC